MLIGVVAVALATLAVGAPANAATTYSISGQVQFGGNPGSPVGAGDVTVVASTSATAPLVSAGSADTDSSGNYTISGLVPGAYYLYFQYNGTAGYDSTWIGEPPYATSAIRATTITGSNVTSQSASLYRPSTIGGQVTLGYAGTPAASGEVMVSYLTGITRNGPWSAESTAIPTDSNGNYAFPNVEAGYYRLHFLYAGTGAYESEYYDGYTPTPFSNEGHSLLTTLGGPFIENIDLPSLESVSGHVSIGTAATPAGAGDVGVVLQYFDENTSAGWTAVPGATTTTNSSGNYSFANLLNFPYRVIFTYNGSGNYMGTTTLALGSPYTSASLTRDVVIPTVYSVTGHVYLGSTARSAGAGEVKLDFENSAYDFSATVLTDASGNYSLSGLPAGDYSVWMEYEGTGPFVIGQLTYGACAQQGCTLDLTSNLSGVDGVVPPSDQVTGTVKSSSTGSPLAGIKVAAREYNSISGVFVGETDSTSGADGRFSFTTLTDGSYEFDLTDPHGIYASTVIDGSPNRIVLNDSQPQDLWTSYLGPGSKINGSVAVPGGSAADIANGDATAETMTPTGTDGAWVETGQYFPIQLSSGAYRYAVTGLSPGQYKLRFDYHGAGGDAVAFSPILTVGDSQSVQAAPATLYPMHPASAVGDFAVDVSIGSITVKGWAAWPSSLSTSVGLAVNVGSAWYPVTANQSNSDFNDTDALGTNHGFSWSLPTAGGEYPVCLWTTEPTGPAVNLGCKSVYVTDAGITQSWLDSYNVVPGGISLSGFAIYPANYSASVGLALNVGNSWFGMTANQSTTEGLTAFPGSGPNHGFSSTFAVAPGTYHACLWVTQLSGPAFIIDCRTVTVAARPNAVAAIDSISGSSAGVAATGYAVYPDSFGTAVNVAVNIGAGWYALSATMPNSEVPVAVPGAGANHGFSQTIPMAPGTYSACVWVAQPSGVATNIGCKTVTVAARPRAATAIDSASGSTAGVTLAGYAVYPDSFGTAVGVALNIGAAWYGFTANGANSEVPTAVPGADANHGFTATVPLAPGTYTACLWVAEPSGPAVEVGCRTVTVPAITPAIASFATAIAVAGGIQVTGYSQFPTSPGTAVGVAANVGSNWYGFTANGANATAPGHGFTGFIPQPHGTYSVCLWTTEPSGPAVSFGCKSVTVP
jgi:hypothetical protein